MKISQCMIVKNEEKNIERALSWGKDVVDEQIVVDTGSTDRTVEIAEKMGAKIYHFEWINDFSAAKNYAIEQCTGDWIAFLDADEYFSNKDAEKLRKMLSQADSQCNVISTPWAQLDASGKINNMLVQARLFKNKPYIRYKNAIHESLSCTDENHKLLVGEIDNSFTIFHTGYAWDENLTPDIKAKRNKEKIFKRIEEDPDNEHNYFYLADNYFCEMELEKSLEANQAGLEIALSKEKSDYLNKLYEQFFNHTIEIYLHYYNQNNKDFDFEQYEKKHRIFERYEQAVKISPEAPDYDFHLGKAFYVICRYEQALTHLEKCNEKILKSEKIGGRAVSHMDELFFMLACSYFETGNMEKFVRYAVECLKLENTVNSLMTTKLIVALMDGGESSQSVFEFLSKLYDFESPKDFMFVLKAAQDVNPPILAQYMIENMPQKLRELM